MTTWTGEGEDGVTWEDPSNWDNGVPGLSDTEATIPSGYTVECSSSNPIGVSCTVSSEAQLTFTGSAFNDGTVIGNAYFTGISFNSSSGSVTGAAVFDTDSYNDGIVDVGDFQGNSYNSGTVSANATFDDSSKNGGTGTVNGNATFNISSYNESGATVQGNATLNHNSNNQGSIQGTATFNDNSSNQGDGVVSGHATFNDFSSHSATVAVDATFNDSSANSGIVGGNATYYGNAYPAGTLNNVAGSHKITNWSRIGSDIKANAVDFRIQFLDVPEGAGGDILGTGLL